MVSILEANGAAQIAALQEYWQIDWKLRFDSDWQGYGDNFEGHWSSKVLTEPDDCDGFTFRSALYIAPYGVLIFSQ